ncbi:hypothetical protein ACS0TY_019185 [Phlomoides rotata]
MNTVLPISQCPTPDASSATPSPVTTPVLRLHARSPSPRPYSLRRSLYRAYFNRTRQRPLSVVLSLPPRFNRIVLVVGLASGIIYATNVNSLMMMSQRNNTTVKSVEYAELVEWRISFTAASVV